MSTWDVQIRIDETLKFSKLRKVMKKATSNKSMKFDKNMVLLNAQKVDGALVSEESGVVTFCKAPWNDAEIISDKPQTLSGKLVCKGEEGGDKLVFVPSIPTGQKLYHEIYHTPHGALRSSAKRVFVSFSFPKEMQKSDIMKYLYKEVLDIKHFCKHLKEEPWEKAK